MRNQILYIVLILLLAAFIGLVLTNRNTTQKKFNERITLKHKDKIPYGTYVAYTSLSYLFRNASISINKMEPGYWDSLSNYDANQALIIISPQFFASEYEMRKLLRFAENGNDVFISTRILSPDAHEMLQVETSLIQQTTMKDSRGNRIPDRLYLELKHPPFEPSKRYTYDGDKYNAWFTSYDSSLTDILGYDDLQHLNFIHLRTGRGNVYVHMAPLAFSNYFLLHQQNIRYMENVLSVISPDISRVVWDEYFLNKHYYNDGEEYKKTSWITVLFRYQGLKWALLIAILTLFLYAFMELWRKQRHIPVVRKPQNDSLDFVKTIGRLYYDKGDHLNLCRKMATYFLEYVRNKYKLPTSVLDEEFARKLQFKSGYGEAGIADIVAFINQLRENAGVTEKQVAAFHKQLEQFYASA